MKGRASHGALPDEGCDATVAASAIVMALQTISSREFSPLDPVVVTVGTLHSGARFNIVSGEAVLEGTVRIFNKDIHPRMPEIIGRIAQDTAAAFRCTAELDYQFKTESLVNEPHMTALARAAAEKLVPGDKIQPFKRSMAARTLPNTRLTSPAPSSPSAAAARPRSTAICSASTRAPWRSVPPSMRRWPWIT